MNEPAVVVTGASTGIGRACALRLASEGFRVFAGVRRDADADALRAASSPLLTPLMLDVTDAAQVDAAAATVRTAIADSRLVGIVNNAGIAVAAPLEFLAIDDLRRQFEVNVFGQLRVAQAFMDMLRDSQGRIVLMSSLGGKLSQPMVGAYCASKFALEALGDALRVEMLPWGVGVAIVEPGAVATPIWGKGVDAADALIDAAPERLHELYGAAVHIARAVARREAEHGVPPERVADAVVHALTASRPRTRYIVGREARIALLLKRVLTDRGMDRVIVRTTGFPTRADATRARASRTPVAGRI